MRRLLVALALAMLVLPFVAEAAPSPSWPSIQEQLDEEEVKIDPASALADLVRANQDFHMLLPDEMKAVRPELPAWIRVWWRKQHPELTYSTSDPTGGYPLVLKEILEWMIYHQDLRIGVPEPDMQPGEYKVATINGEQRISGAQTSPRSESAIQINFFDPTKIISGSNSIQGGGRQSQFWSTDGGTTWGQTTLPFFTGDTSHSDPTVDWTSDSTAWSSTLGIVGGSLRLRTYRSTDFGATWLTEATPSGTQTSVDKQMHWIDHSATSPFQNTQYITYHNGLPSFVVVRNPTTGTWSGPVQLSGAESTGTAIGGEVKTNSAGDAFVFWPTTGNRRIIMRKSTDGGTTWAPFVQVATTFDGFDIGIPSFNSRRAFIYVSAGAYRTPTKNNVYATWTDLTGETGCTAAGNEPGTNVASNCKTRIWFSRSTDGGATWSAAVMVNNQAGRNDQFSQWLAVDETTGALGLMYQDTVEDPGRLASHVFYQSSFNDGVTWSAPVRISSQPTNEVGGGADGGNQYGDYNGLSGYAGVFFPSWTDRRGGLREEIWTARVSDPACTFPGNPASATAAASAPNTIQVSWTNGAPAGAQFNIYRALGTCAAPGPFTRIATGVAASPYLDATVSGSLTYAYRVTATDATGVCESAVSNCIEATATGVCNAAPTFAGATNVTNQAQATCGLTVNWSAAGPFCGGPATYNVYRDTTPGFTPTLANRIATGVSGTSYSDTSPLVFNTTYYYIVRAVDSANGIEETNSVQRSAFPTGPVAVANLNDTFEGGLSGGGFDTAGWSHQALAGAVDWAWSTAQAQTPTHSWFSDSQTSVTQRVLVSPAFTVQPTTTLSFWHTFAFEGTVAQCFDAGVLEITTNGGTTWGNVPDAAFTAGGFNGTVNGGFANPLAGRRAWCSGTIGAMTQVTVNLGGTFAGQDVRLRWHEADDSSAEATGWFVDSVSITNAGTPSGCAPSPVELLDFEVD